MKKTNDLSFWRRRQRGYVVGQSVMAATLATGLVGAVGTDWSTQMSMNANLQAQTSVSAQINTAVGVYMTLYYMTLSDMSALPTACEQTPYRAGTAPSTGAAASSAAAASCSATFSYTRTASDGSTQTITYTVPNAVQPTVADLKALNLIDSSLLERPVVPVSVSVSTGAPTAAGGAAPQDNRYGIAIQRRAVPSGVVLNSLVFNAQPYQLSRTDLAQLVRLSNGQAGGSGLPDTGSSLSASNPDYLLTEAGRAWTLPNPVRQSVSDGSGASRDIGMPGIVGWRNGFDASTALQTMRRDGTTPPTSDWDFNNHAITNVKSLSAQTLATSGNVEVGGALTVKGTFTALTDLIVQGTTSLQALTVAGAATFTGPVTVNNNVTVADGKTLTVGSGTNATVVAGGNISTPALTTPGLRTSANGTVLGAAGAPGVDAGAACSETNALAQQNGTGVLMLCRGNVWVSAYKSNVSASSPGSACAPEASMGMSSDGSVLVCKGGTWQYAGDQISAGDPCKTRGALGRSVTSQAVANLLVCNGTTWTADIYAKPKSVLATVGMPCRTDEVNALARNQASPTSGFLVCTAVAGGASWQSPFAEYDDSWVDSNESLQVQFAWAGWAYCGLGNPVWGQFIIGSPTVTVSTGNPYDYSTNSSCNYNPGAVQLVHMKNGAVIGSQWATPTMSCPPGSNGCSTGNAGPTAPGQANGNNYSILTYQLDGSSLNLPQDALPSSAWTNPATLSTLYTFSSTSPVFDVRWRTTGGHVYMDIWFYRDDGGNAIYQLQMNKINNRRYVTTG